MSPIPNMGTHLCPVPRMLCRQHMRLLPHWEILKKIVWKLIFSKAFQQSASCSSGKTNPVLSILSLFSLLLHLLLPQTCWEVPFPARILRKASKNPNKDKQILASLFLMGLMVPLRPVVIPLKAPGPAVRGNTTFIKKQPKEDISCCLSW